MKDISAECLLEVGDEIWEKKYRYQMNIFLKKHTLSFLVILLI
jgi:hypothetical protein